MTDDIRQTREVDPVRRQIGQNVKAELIRQGLGQEAVGEALGVSQPQISRRIAGSIGFEAAEIARVAHMLGVSPDRLMDVPAALLDAEPTEVVPA